MDRPGPFCVRRSVLEISRTKNLLLRFALLSRSRCKATVVWIDGPTAYFKKRSSLGRPARHFPISRWPPQRHACQTPTKHVLWHEKPERLQLISELKSAFCDRQKESKMR